jgi:hypothetical protein
MPDSGAGRIREQEHPPGRRQPGKLGSARARMLLHHHIDATGTDALAGVLIPDLVSHVNQRAARQHLQHHETLPAAPRASKPPMIDLKMQPTSLAGGRPILTAIKVSVPDRNTFFEPSD